jgi:hypothetical protein
VTRGYPRTVQHVFFDSRVSFKRGESIPEFSSKRIAARLGLSVIQGALTRDHCNNKNPENPDSRYQDHLNLHTIAKTSSITTYFAHHRTKRFVVRNQNPGGEIEEKHNLKHSCQARSV